MLITFVSPAKTAEPIEMPFGGWLMWAQGKNHLLDGGLCRTNSFAAARGDKAAMRPFVKILRPLVFFFLLLSNGTRNTCAASTARRITWLCTTEWRRRGRWLVDSVVVMAPISSHPARLCSLSSAADRITKPASTTQDFRCRSSTDGKVRNDSP